MWLRAEQQQQQPPAGLSRIELVRRLTHPDNYNKHIRPLDGEAPLNVSARTYIYLAQSIEGRLHLVRALMQTAPPSPQAHSST